MRLFGHCIKFTHDRGNSCGEHHNAANGTWHAIWLKINLYFALKINTMKQLRSILLLLLFLHSKVGVALNVHYCGGQIAAISWAFLPDNCGIEMKKVQVNFPSFPLNIVVMMTLSLNKIQKIKSNQIKKIGAQ